MTQKSIGRTFNHKCLAWFRLLCSLFYVLLLLLMSALSLSLSHSMSPTTILISKMYITVKAEKSTSGHLILYTFYLFFSAQDIIIIMLVRWSRPLLLRCMEKKHFRIERSIEFIAIIVKHRHLLHLQLKNFSTISTEKRYVPFPVMWFREGADNNQCMQFILRRKISLKIHNILSIFSWPLFVAVINRIEGVFAWPFMEGITCV